MSHPDKPKVQIPQVKFEVPEMNKEAQKGAPQPATEVSAELKEMMQQAISMEMQVSIQYMWQHVTWTGIKGYAFHDALKDVAIEEMKHAERIAERLFYLGELPNTKPSPITLEEGLAAVVKQNDKDERATIGLYKKIIRQAMDEGDEVTAQIFREILVDEEDHHDLFISVLEQL